MVRDFATDLLPVRGSGCTESTRCDWTPRLLAAASIRASNAASNRRVVVTCRLRRGSLAAAMNCSGGAFPVGGFRLSFGFFPIGIGYHLTIILIDERHQRGQLVDGLWVAGCIPRRLYLGRRRSGMPCGARGAIEVVDVGTLAQDGGGVRCPLPGMASAALSTEYALSFR